MASTNQCFYWDTISKKSVTQGWRVLSAYETHYPPPNTKSVFWSLGDIIIIATIIIISLFKVDFTITFQNYKKLINVNLPMKPDKNVSNLLSGF